MLKGDLWKDGGRLKFFSRNPNRSALLLTQLVLIISGLLFFCRNRCLIVLGGIVSCVGCALVALTQSRGGLLALATGLGLTFLLRFRRRFNVRILLFSIIIGSLFIGGATYYMCGSAHATHSGLHDDSSSRRLYMWREVPRMLAAAPLGWGLWQSGPAYNSWFEKPNRMHMTGDLFNDHLSRFVEGGFVFGGIYVFLWVFAFIASGRHAWQGGSPVPLALFASYFVASSFNPMNYWVPSFYLMGAYLLAAFLWYALRNKFHRLPVLFLIAISATITLVILVSVVVVVIFSDTLDIPLGVSPLGRRVVVGEGEPRVWVADDGFVLCGDYNGFPGRELHDYYRRHPHVEAIGLVESLSALPPKTIDCLVITGRLCEKFLADPNQVSARRILVYSPPFGSERIKPDLRNRYNIEFVTGEFAARLTGDDHVRKRWVHIVPAAGLYVPRWLEFVLKK